MRWPSRRALIIVVICLVALVSVVDSVRGRLRIREMEKDLSERDQIIEQIRKDRLSIEAQIQDMLKKRKGPWRAPENANETASRFRALGY